MGFRKAITIEEFKEKVEEVIWNKEENLYDPDNLSDTLKGDLDKVYFSMENFSCSCQEEGYYGGKYPCGYEEIAQGFPILWCNSGGDWEVPIVFILYWDGEEVRAYIPENGNVFDKFYRTAYGSQRLSMLWDEEDNMGDLEPDQFEIEGMLSKEDMVRDIVTEIEEL